MFDTEISLGRFCLETGPHGSDKTKDMQPRKQFSKLEGSVSDVTPLTCGVSSVGGLSHNFLPNVLVLDIFYLPLRSKGAVRSA